MPYKEPQKFISVSDCSIASPAQFPGKHSRNNKNGTLMTKDDWKEQEAKRWFHDQQSDKYDRTPFNRRANLLYHWFNKSFKMSQIEVNELLLKIESEATDQSDESDSEDLNFEAAEDDNEDDLMDIDLDNPSNSPDMFEMSDIEDQVDDSQTGEKTRVQKDVEKEKTIQSILKLSDKELVESESLPEFVLKDSRYLGRKNSFIKNLIDDMFDPETASSQDILNQMTQLPSYVRDHKLLKDKIDHLSKAEKSTKRIVKNLRETLCELRKDSARKAFEQRVTIVAAATDHRYGIPDLGETQHVNQSARKLKLDFMSGKKTNLEPKKSKQPERYPAEVFKLAQESWINRSTKPDPAKHANPKRAKKDGQETVVTLRQVVTDDEAYIQFKESDTEKVREAICKKNEEVKIKYQGRPDSDNKRKILETLARREDIFPSKTWFLSRKPPETKMLDDHTTALCKDCVSAQLNYEAIYKARKRFCKCRTKRCASWVCLCDVEDIDQCECKHPCDCDNCMSCQVNFK